MPMWRERRPDRREDRWADLGDPASVAAAAERLRQFANAPSELAARERFLGLLAPAPGDHVLDVGAGTGEITRDLLQRVHSGGTVTALDPSRGLLELALDGARKAGLDEALVVEVGDARALPHANDRFDIAFCHWVLLHVAPAKDVIDEMVRVVRPGGRIMCVEVDWETLTIYPGNRDVTRRIVRANVDRQVDGWMGRRLVPLLRRAGLRNVRVEAIVDVDTDGDEGGWLKVVESRLLIAVDAGVVAGAEAERWWAELEAAVTAGDYFFSITQFAVVGDV